ncbi:DUF421 domain-containing protein [Aeoliella sp. SH292]|uniref:DUF421 domain-containing protein n=1 Tax=Aeoliella sp. SH292 TaxID=3454464 RepID=UPI003F9DBE58
MNIDWHALFVPDTSLPELILRGTFMYIALLAALRVLVRRHIGSMSLMDLLLMVLIADAAQNGMADEYRSLTEGAVLCGTLFAWNYLFDWLSYRYKWFQRILEPAPLPVIQNGKMLRRNMQRELITKDELQSQLREQGVHDVSEVEFAFIEPDGGVSVFRKDGTSEAKGADHQDKKESNFG